MPVRARTLPNQFLMLNSMVGLRPTRPKKNVLRKMSITISLFTVMRLLRNGMATGSINLLLMAKTCVDSGTRRSRRKAAVSLKV